MEDIKVSVIIPVYNTQEFVREAVESITGQSLRDIEVIVVDDGSTDNSPAIIRGLAAADPRIRIFTQPNQGQSGARNLGLDNARGEYIYFMDSDDLLRPDTLETCYNKCRAQLLDFVAFDADIFGDSDGVFCSDFYHRTAGMEDRTYRGIELMNLMMDQHRFRVPIWLSVIRRAFLEEHGLRFIPGSTHEDELFTALCYIQAKRAGIIPQSFFRRRVRGSSTMTTRFAWRNMDSYFRVTDELIRFAGIHGQDTGMHSINRTGNDCSISASKSTGRNDNGCSENGINESDARGNTGGTPDGRHMAHGRGDSNTVPGNTSTAQSDTSTPQSNAGVTRQTHRPAHDSSSVGQCSPEKSDSDVSVRYNDPRAHDNSRTADGHGREVRDAVDRFLFRMLNPAVCRAHVMPLADRLKIARLCLTRYSGYIKPRTLAVLLLKGPLDKITGRK